MVRLFPVPGAGPENVQANATSSTTVVVSWGDILPLQRNGIILGYKVYYGYKGDDFKVGLNFSTKGKLYHGCQVPQ